MRDDLLLEKANRMNVLIDFYGALLTDKQRTYVHLYFTEDLSLSEIAEEQQVSRQAVNDHLRRACDLLDDYELKLRLMHKHQQRTFVYQQLKDTVSNANFNRENRDTLLHLLDKIQAIDEE
jgi:predicted DNA-binding protein YlxM (UPF0122 family)